MDESAQVRSVRISFCFTSSILSVMWQMYELGKRGKEFMAVNNPGKGSWRLNYRFWQRRKGDDRDQGGRIDMIW